MRCRPENDLHLFGRAFTCAQLLMPFVGQGGQGGATCRERAAEGAWEDENHSRFERIRHAQKLGCLGAHKRTHKPIKPASTNSKSVSVNTG